jgi:hypothetical protein
MNSAEATSRNAQCQALLSQLTAAEAALRSNLDLGCADVTARVHMQRALAHIEEAMVALNRTRRARTVWQLVQDLTKCRRDLDENRSDSVTRTTMRSTH